MIEKIINWILGHLPAVIFVVILIAQALRAAGRAKQTRTEHERSGQDPRHEQQAQEEVRRRIAERRAGRTSSAPVPETPAPRAAPSPQTTQLPEVFDGPLGRMLQELQKRAAPPPEPPPPMLNVQMSNTAELERQQQIAAQLKSLEEARATAKRRAAHLAAEKADVAQAAPALRTAARGRLLADLRHPQSLRGALVLREVLGSPVALR